MLVLGDWGRGENHDVRLKVEYNSPQLPVLILIGAIAGKTHGFACVVDGNGTVIYEGEFKDGKRHGLGRQLFDSGDMYEGGWPCKRR